jgi:hypothetical protein
MRYQVMGRMLTNLVVTLDLVARQPGRSSVFWHHRDYLLPRPWWRNSRARADRRPHRWCRLAHGAVMTLCGARLVA